jgi:hypothetical protein
MAISISPSQSSRPRDKSGRTGTKILAAVAMATSCTPAPASIRTFGRKSLRVSQWTGALEEMVNSPLRVEAMSSFGKTEFYYDCNGRQLNDLITQFASLKAGSVYLTVGPSRGHVATLQVLDEGDHSASLTINVSYAAQLSELHIPAAVRVEALPSVGQWIDPAKQQAEAALWAKVEAFVATRARKTTGEKDAG